jgi:alkanesulfonate monooxygenase SsuD/methylene tetrahydromethanopterin reductase-like flavin-dependent oxidoreductase (luciferase family)
MRVYQFTEQPYFPAWTDHAGSLRVNLPNGKQDPAVAADLLHRYYDEWRLADELGLDIMVNEHHSTATCMSSTAIVALSVLARETKRARLLVLGYPIGHRPDPLRAAEELAAIDVLSRGRLDMGFIKGVPYEFPVSNQNPVGTMDRFWEAHDFILKAMTSHDAPFNWESETFHYRHVNLWPRPYQAPHPPVWSTTGSRTNARVLGEKGYVMATLGTGFATRPLFDAYRKGYVSRGRAAPAADRFAYLGLVAVASDEASSRARAEIVASYLRSSSIVAPQFRNPPGYLSIQHAHPARRDTPAQQDQGRPRHRHAQRERPGPDRRRHHVRRHARPSLQPDRRLLRILRRHGQPHHDGPCRPDVPRGHRRQPDAVCDRGPAATQGLSAAARGGACFGLIMAKL